MALVQAQVEELGDNRVRVTVDVPGHDVRHAVEHAASDLAESVRIPGFRKGKVPMPVLISRVGRERIMAEAVESHIGGWFWNAAAQQRLRPVAQPEYDFELPDSERGDWRFTATVSVQPKPQPADWTKLEVPRIAAEVPEDVIGAELDLLRGLVADLSPTEGRAAQPGDVVVIDLESPDAAERGYVAELGAGALPPEIESALVGLSAGENREVAATTEGGDGRIRVTLEEVYEKVLPPLDDELARAASEFDTFDELREDVERELREQLEDEAESAFRSAVVDALVEASNVDAAGQLVESRTRELVAGLVRSV
jgi:trigger factor